MLTQGVGDLVLLLEGLGLAFLGEDGLEHRSHGRALLGLGMGQQVARRADATVLMRRVEDAERRGAQAFVVVGEDELDTPEAALGAPAWCWRDIR